MRIKVFLICMIFLALCVNTVHAADEVEGDAVVLDVYLVSQNPDPAVAGEDVELRFMVENLGGKEANNPEFELILQYPFTAIPGEEYLKTVKTLSAHQKGSDAVIIKYKVRVDKDAIKGTNEIRLRSREAGSDSYSISTLEIEVTGKEYAQIIYVDKAKIDPGKETKLNFTITNVGNSPLKNLLFSWSEKNGIILPVYSDDTKYIKYIDVGDSVELEYIVVADINTVSGLYQLDLNLEYETEEGETKEKSTKAGIFVGGETDFDVTFSESSEGQTSLYVANAGNNPALSVTVRIPEQSNFGVSGSASSIIGNLDRGDYTIVSFQITQAAGGGFGAAGMGNMSQLTDEQRQKLRGQFMQMNATNATTTQSNNLKVQIEYTDTTGARHVVEKEVAIQFRSVSGTEEQIMGFRQRANSSTDIISYIILAAIIVAGIVCYRKRAPLRAFIRKKLNRKRG